MAKDILETRIPLASNEAEMDSRLFAHIHHDARLTGSHLQGETLFRTTNYIRKVLAYVQTPEVGLLKSDQKKQTDRKNEAEGNATEEAHEQKEIKDSLEQTQRLLTNLGNLESRIEIARNSLSQHAESISEIYKGFRRETRRNYLRYSWRTESAPEKEEGPIISEGIDDIAKSIIDTLNAKESNGEILIPGGWVGKDKLNKGHAMIYKLKKEADGSITFLIFNTGAGLNQYHLNHPSLQDRYLPVMAYKIPPEGEKDLQSFVVKLLEPRITPPITNSSNSEIRYNKEFQSENVFDQDKLYTNVFSKIAYLGGKKIDPKPYCKGYIKGQIAGTCALRAVLPVLQNELHRKAFQTSLYQLKRSSMLDYYQLHRKKLGERTRQRLLNKANQQFLKTTRRFLKRKDRGKTIITEDQAKQNLAIFNTIQQGLKLEAPSKVSQPLKALDIPEISSRTSQFNVSAGVTVKVEGTREPIDLAPYENMPNPNQYPYYNNRPAYIKAVQQTMQRNNKGLHSESIIKDFEDFILSIPLDPVKATEYWNSIHPSQAKEMFDSLQDMLRIYGRHCYLRTGYPFARRAITSQSALLVARHLVCMHFNLNPNFYKITSGKDYFQARADNSLAALTERTFGSKMKEITDPFSVTGDPTWDERVNELRNITKEFSDYNSSGSADNNNWDFRLIEKHRLEYATLAQSKETKRDQPPPADHMERTRLALYNLANGTIDSRGDTQFRGVLSDFDFRLQLQEFCDECSLFREGGFDYFKDLEALSDTGKRLSKVTFSPAYSQSTWGNYRSNYNFNTNRDVTSRNIQNLANALQIKHKIAEKTIFPDAERGYTEQGEYHENEAMLYYAGLAEKLREDEVSGYPIFALPFTRVALNETRIIATKDFFESNLERLADRDFQIVFWLNFCTPLLLNKQIDRTPELAQNLVKVLEEGIKFHQQGQEIGPGAIFCLRLSYFLQKYFSHGPNKEKFKSVVNRLNQMDNYLESALQNHELSLSKETELTKRHQVETRLKDLYDIYTLRSTLKNETSIPDTPEKIKAMLKVIIARHLTIGESSLNRDVFLEDELEHGLKALAPFLQRSFQKLNESDQREILNSIVNNLIPRVFEPDSDSTEKFNIPDISTFPNITILYEKNRKLEKLSLDFSLGILRSQQGILRSIPSEYYSQEIVHFFGNQNFFGQVVDTKEGRMAEFEIEVQPTKETKPTKADLIFATELKTDKDVILPEDTKELKAQKDEIKEKIKYRIIIDMEGIAHLHRWFPNDNKWFELQAKNSFQPSNELPIHFTEEDRRWWVDAEEKPPSTFYSIDEAGNYLLQIKKSKDGYEVNELYSTGKETGYRLATFGKMPKYLEHLEKFEDPKFIEYWFNTETKSDIPYKISLKRYGLNFDCKREGNSLKLVWKENPNYVLLTNDFQAILDFPNILYLENENTKEKIAFVPKQEFYVKATSENEGLLDAKETGDREPFETEGEYYRLSLDIGHAVPSARLKNNQGFWNYTQQEQYYQIPMSKEGVLMPKTPEQYLYLASLHLSKHDPQSAMDALRKCNELGGIQGTKEEISLIQKIMTNIPAKEYNPKLQEIAKTNDPETISVRLYAAWLLAEFKQVSLDKPRFSLTQKQEPSVFKNKNERLEFLNEKDRIKFFTEDFTSEVENLYHDLLHVRGAVAEDMQLSLDQELSLLRTVYKEKKELINMLEFSKVIKKIIQKSKSLNEPVKDTKPISPLKLEDNKDSKDQEEFNPNAKPSTTANLQAVKRWRELELMQLRKEERYHVKKLAQIQSILDKNPRETKQQAESVANTAKEKLALKKKLRREEAIRRLPHKKEILEKRLVKIREILKRGNPYFLKEYFIRPVQVSVIPSFDSTLTEQFVKLYYSDNCKPSQKPKELSLNTTFGNIVSSFSQLYKIAKMKNQSDFEKWQAQERPKPLTTDSPADNKLAIEEITSTTTLLQEKQLLTQYLQSVLNEYLEKQASSKMALVDPTPISDHLASVCNSLLYVIENPDRDWPEFPGISKDNSKEQKAFFEALATGCKAVFKEKPIKISVTEQTPILTEQTVSAKKERPVTHPLNSGLVPSTTLFDLAKSSGFESVATQYRNLKIPLPLDAPELLDVKSLTETFFQKEAANLREDLKKGIQNNQERRARGTLAFEAFKDPNVRNTLNSNLSNSINALQENLKNDLLSTLKYKLNLETDNKKTSEQLLLELANRKLTGEKVLLQTQLKIGSKERFPLLKFNDLLMLYLKNDLELFKEKTRLDEKEIQELYACIHNFLINQSLVKQAERIQKIIKDSSEIPVGHPDLQRNLQDLAEQLFATRSFSPEEHPELLAFEFTENILLRPNQAETIISFLEEGPEGFSNQVAQLIMGGGKSKIILPFLALKKANGTNLSIIEVPQSLYETNLSDLRSTTQRFFGKQAHRFLFSRESPCSSTNLKALVKKLRQLMTDQEYIVTTAESVQALELKYWELLELAPAPITQHSTEEDREKRVEWETQIKILDKLVKLFKEQGDALLDEVDGNLDPKKELNYTIGPAAPIKDEYLKTILEVFNLFDQVQLNLPSGSATLEQVMLGEVAIPPGKDWIEALNALSRTLIENSNSPLFAFTNTLSLEQKKALDEYFSEGIQEQPDDPLKIVQPKPIPDFIENLKDEKLKKTIGLLRGELQFLKYTLRKKANEHFGFPKSKEFTESREVAIPYIANNTPNERAQFGSYYETINYTLQLQFQRKELSLAVLKEFLTDFHKRAHQQIGVMLGGITFEQTQAYHEFFELTGLTLNTIHPSDTAALQKIQDLKSSTDPNIILKSKNIQNYCLFNYILKKIKHYPKILRNDAVNHASLYRSRQGFTGTPWNVRCFHPDMFFDPESGFGIDGETYDHVQKAKVSVAQTKEPKQIIEHLFQTHADPNRIHAFIDVGALFKGKENEEIARLFAENFISNQRSIKHILYFNRENVLCALPVEAIQRILAKRATGKNEEADKEEKDLMPIIIGSSHPTAILKATGSTPEQCFTYYDQVHTTGTDIRQPLHSIGIETVDIDSDARDFLQGAMRMRDLANTQKVEILVSRDMALTRPDLKGYTPREAQRRESQDDKDLKVPRERSLSTQNWELRDVTNQLIKNQWTKLAEYHFQSALQKMNNLIRDNLGKLIRDEKSMAEKEKLFKEFHESFILNISDDPFFQFGSVDLWQNSEAVLQHLASQYLIKWKEKLSNQRRRPSDDTYLFMKDSLEKIVKESSEYCLKFRKHIPKEGEGRVVQVQTQQQMEKKKDKRQELDQQLGTEKPKLVPNRHAPYEIFPFIDKKESTWMWGRSQDKPKKLNDALAEKDKKPPFRFNDNLYISYNYQSTYQTQKDPLDKKKPMHFALFIESPNTDPTLNGMLITQADADDFSALLDKRREEFATQGIKVEIVSTHNDIRNRTNTPITHPGIASLKEQICYFNGDLDHLAKNLGNVNWLLTDTKPKLDYLKAELLTSYPEKVPLVKTFSASLESVRLFKNIQAAITSKDVHALSLALKEVLEIEDPFLRKNILNANTEQGYHILNFAISQGELKLVDELLRHKEFDPKQVDGQGRPPLLVAFQSKNEALIRRFLALSTPETLPDINNLQTLASYLLLSSRLDNSEYFKIFYDKLMSLDSKERYQVLTETPHPFANQPLMLEMISTANSNVLVQLLQNPDLPWKPKTDKWEDPLSVALKRNDIIVANLFLTPQFLPEQTQSWFNLLEIAIKSKNNELFKAVLNTFSQSFNSLTLYNILTQKFKTVIANNDALCLKTYVDFLSNLESGWYFQKFKADFFKQELKNRDDNASYNDKIITGPLALALECRSPNVLETLLEIEDTTLFNIKNTPKERDYQNDEEVNIEYCGYFLNQIIEHHDVEALNVFLEKMKKQFSEQKMQKLFNPQFKKYDIAKKIFEKLGEYDQQFLKEYSQIFDILLETPGFLPPKHKLEAWQDFWILGASTCKNIKWDRFKHLLENFEPKEQAEILKPRSYGYAFLSFLNTCSEDIIQYILPKIENVNMIDKYHGGILHKIDNVHRLRFFLNDQRFNINLADEDGNTPALKLFKGFTSYSISLEGKIKAMEEYLNAFLNHPHFDPTIKNKEGKDLKEIIIKMSVNESDFYSNKSEYPKINAMLEKSKQEWITLIDNKIKTRPSNLSTEL